MQFSMVLHYKLASLLCLKLKEIFDKCHLNDLLSFTLKSEVDTKLVKNIVRKWAHQVAWCFVKHINIK